MISPDAVLLLMATRARPTLSPAEVTGHLGWLDSQGRLSFLKTTSAAGTLAFSTVDE